MAAKRKRPVLDLAGRRVVHLDVLPELPKCFGSYEADLCTGEFCPDVFARCQQETLDAGNPSTENVSVHDDDAL